MTDGISEDELYDGPPAYDGPQADADGKQDDGEDVTDDA